MVGVGLLQPTHNETCTHTVSTAYTNIVMQTLAQCIVMQTRAGVCVCCALIVQATPVLQTDHLPFGTLLTWRGMMSYLESTGWLGIVSLSL